jgi:magnesium transporter
MNVEAVEPEAVVSTAVSTFLTSHPTQAAAVLEREQPADIAEVLSPLSSVERAEILRRMSLDTASVALRALDDTAASETLEVLDPVKAGQLLEACGEKSRERLLAGVSETTAKRIREALDFPPGTAGHLMDAAVLSFRAETTIGQAFDLIRGRKRRIADVLICEGDKLVGVVPLQELVGSPAETPLGSVAHSTFPSVHPMASRDEVVELLTKYRLVSLPVVDLHGQLLGTIRYDGLVLATQEAAAEDLQRMVGAGKEERALSPPVVAIKSRLPWLMINLVTAFAAAFVVGMFDETIARFTALAVLLPVVAGQSGNTGAQALAVTSRGLALREIRVSHWFRVLAKETIASLGNGLAIAFVTAGAVFVFSRNPGLTLVIGVSMVVSMLIAAMAGAMVPVVLTASGRDPATASSIILTTVTDIAGFFSFLGLATLMVDWL